MGERSIVPLKDGSTIYLNTASRIALQSGRNLRSVSLLSGEALFHVPAQSKPLYLNVDDLRIDSRGAQWDIRREATETKISVLEGIVRLSCDCSPREVALAAGQQVLVDRQTGINRIQHRTLTTRERSSLITWRDGHLDFDGQTLAEAAKEFNRYNRLQLSVVDADTSRLRIGGSFLATDVESFVAAMHKTFGVEVRLANVAGDNSTTTVLMSRKAPQAVASAH